MRYVLGIDVGTAGCKASLFTLEGQEVGRGYRETPVRITEENGWIEQDPRRWWAGVAGAVREAVAGRNPRRVLGLGVSTANAAVFLDERGKAVRPAIMQLDRRAAEESEGAEEIAAREGLHDVTGNRFFAGMSWAPKLMWLQAREPETCRRIRRILSPGGYIVFRLTGTPCIDPSRAATSGLLDIRTGQWSSRVCKLLGLRSDWLPPVMRPEAPAGHVTPAAARATGLAPGTPVAAGCMDSLAALLALGGTAPGGGCVLLGSVGRLCRLFDAPRFDKRFMNAIGPLPGSWLALAPVSGTGTSVRWFRHLQKGKETYATLDKEASRTPAGKDDLLYLPFLEGIRAPHWSSAGRAVFYGIQPHHRRGHLLRAIYEGVACALRENEEVLRSLYGPPSLPLPLAGGGAESRIWPQIMADVLELPVRTSKLKAAEGAGAAAVSLWSLEGGSPGSLPEAVTRFLAALRGSETVWSPRKEHRAGYRRKFSLFKSLCSDLFTGSRKPATEVKQGRPDQTP